MMQQPHPQVGDIWRDADERSKGAGEFTVEGVGETYVLVRRHATGRRSRMLIRRMVEGQYVRIGAGR